MSSISSSSSPVPVRWLASTDSTQLEAERLRAAGLGPPFAVVADRQTAGRGTSGRSWVSPAGGLYFTVVLDSRGLAATFAGFAVGVAVAETLGAPVGLKWPNDFVVAGGKVGGLLGEIRGNAAQVGVGLNLTTAKDALRVTDVPALPPATLRDLPIASTAPEILATRLVSAAVRRWDRVRTEGAAPLLRRWESLCVHRDSPVTFRDADGETCEGRFLGLADDGAATVMVRGERRTFHAGELRLTGR